MGHMESSGCAVPQRRWLGDEICGLSITSSGGCAAPLPGSSIRRAPATELREAPSLRGTRGFEVGEGGVDVFLQPDGGLLPG